MSEPRKPITVGVWLELPPDVSLHGEGIMRTLMAVISALAPRDDVRIVIAVAAWNGAAIRELLADWGVSPDRVRVVVSRDRVPIAVRARRRRRRRAPERRWRLGDFARWAGSQPWLRGTLGRLFGTASPVVAATLALVAGLLLIATAPLWLLAAAVVWMVRLTRRRFPRVRRRMRQRVTMFVGGHYSWLRDALAESEFRRLAARANRHAGADVWFVTHPGSVHALDLAAPIVVAVPDLVYVEFPTLFDRAWADGVDARARSIAARASRFISYSEHVAKSHVTGHLGVPAARVRVIPHAPFDASRNLAAPDGSSDAVARQRLHEFTRRLHRHPQRAYLEGFPFAEVDYLFVSSQIRPTKNYLNLLRAFEQLLREEHRNVKLIMTGDLWRPENKPLLDHIARAGLGLDVLAVPGLPSAEHAAFMHLAALTVVPTLFEGGFPFPFSESVSVGTPVVMSDIAITRPMIPEALRDRMLFDPYDVGAIRRRVAAALDDRDALLAEQRVFREQLAGRTWESAADDYLSVFREAAADPVRESKVS